MKTYYFGDPASDTVLVQFVDDHDLAMIEQEVRYIRELTGHSDFQLVAVKVDNWNHDLTPWAAPPVFGTEGFGDGAQETLSYLTKELLPSLKRGIWKTNKNQANDISGDSEDSRDSKDPGGLRDPEDQRNSKDPRDFKDPRDPGDPRNSGDHRASGGCAVSEASRQKAETSPSAAAVMGESESPARLYIGGYSLSGLFALWAAYQTEIFDGVAAVSPSVWYPGFQEYVGANAVRTQAVYLSLGDKEEKTRNRTMAQVGDAIRGIGHVLQERNIPSVLEWNRGNHFKEPDLRTAKGFAWLMNRC